MNPDLSVKIGRLILKNPVMVASGTFGYAEEFADFMDLKKLGAFVSKTITLKPRKGNPAPRTCETPAGLLNSVGLENPGIEAFLREKLPGLKELGIPLIISIASERDPQELVELARELEGVKEAVALELNISCPNLKKERLIAQDAQETFDLVSAVRRVSTKMLITKLSPNVTDIAEIALAAEKAGSDALSLINTLSAMCIDVQSRKPKIAAGSAGLSGPAIRPLAVRMVHEAYRKIKVPIIGMGGIIDTLSALEFIIAGASAVSVGTANFINPSVSVEIIQGLKEYLLKEGIGSLSELVGSLKI